MKVVTLSFLLLATLVPAFTPSAQAAVCFGPASRWVVFCRCPSGAGDSVEQTFQSLASAMTSTAREAALHGIRCSPSEVSCGAFQRCE